MAGDDFHAIVAELRKQKVPGQEPILKLLEILNRKIEAKGSSVWK
jgi:hypothetical protein